MKDSELYLFYIQNLIILLIKMDWIDGIYFNDFLINKFSIESITNNITIIDIKCKKKYV